MSNDINSKYPPHLEKFREDRKKYRLYQDDKFNIKETVFENKTKDFEFKNNEVSKIND